MLGDEAPSPTSVYKWFGRFRSGHFDLNDEEREGRPRRSTDQQCVAAVQAALVEDPRLTIERLEETLKIDATSIWRILHDDLGFTKKAAKWVPKMLTAEQKEQRVSFCQEFLRKFNDGASANFRNIVTGDEAWFHQFDPLTKSQSMVWSPKGAAPPQKAKRVRSAGKTMFAIFFSQQGVMASVPLDQGSTVTSAWYVNTCLPAVFEGILQGRQKGQLRRHFLHHDNAPAHTAQNTVQFLEESGIKLTGAPAYSPDLAPCDFWLFPKIKQPLRGKLFATRQELIDAVNQQLSQLSLDDFRQCFDDWLLRLRKCIQIGGDYVERSRGAGDSD